MDFFDKFGKFLDDKVEKSMMLREHTGELNEDELIEMYRHSKRKKEWLAMGTAASHLKSKYGWTSEEIGRL